MGFGGKLWGVLTLILGLAFLYVTAYQIPHWVSFMPDTYLKTLFWIGYLLLIGISIGVKPFMILIKDDEGSPFGVLQGVISFILGVLLSIILYYVFDAFFGTSGAFTGSNALKGDLTSIMWFIYIIVTLLSVVVVPVYLSLEEPFTNEIAAQMGVDVGDT